VNWLFWGVGFSRGHQIGIGQLEVIAERWNIEVFFFFFTFSMEFNQHFRKNLE